MSKFRAYPTNIGYEPHERSTTRGMRSLRAIYRSSAKSILTGNDHDVITGMLEGIEEEKYEDLIENINSVLAEAVQRMDALHSLLGAFDIDADGVLSKPDAEKIDWESVSN